MVEKVPETVTSAKMYALLGYGRAQFERIAEAGFIKSRGPNCWPVIDTFQGVIRYLRHEGRQQTSSATQSRVQAARAKEIELRIAQRSGELCETDEAIALVDDIIGTLRSELGGLPAMVTRDLKLRADIEKGLDDILNRIAKRLIMQAEAVEASGEVATRPVALNS
jgi:phage terminase Nu1 subunit (DNA packaging protein)